VVKKVGAKIRQLRIAKGLSQMKFAHKCELELSTINRIELGKLSPSISLLFLFASKLEVEPEELLRF
jgi:transcriptional regulator with XRE-family HTH domain